MVSNFQDTKPLMDLIEDTGANSIAVTKLEQAVDGFYRVVFRDLNTVKK